MTDRIDLEPAGTALLATLAGVEDEHLDRPTPCFDHTVGELLQHLVTVTQVLHDTAEKRLGPATELKLHARDWPELEAGWRAALKEQIPRLVQAWGENSAWEGTTQKGDLDLTGNMAGRITIDELVLHGWDLARAIGVDYSLDRATASTYLELIRRVEQGTSPTVADPPVSVAHEAPVLDRLIAISGRDPQWSPR